MRLTGSKAQGPARTYNESKEEEEEECSNLGDIGIWVQGYLAHKKHPTPNTLQQDYTQGPMVVLGGGAVSHEQGTHVATTCAALPTFLQEGIC